MAQWSWGKVRPMAGQGGGDGPGYGLLQDVRGYWEALRVAGALPDRASIDPRGLEQALEHVFMVERIAPGLARFRIAGMHLALLMGMEVRGMPLSALFDPAGRDRMQKLVEQVFAGPAILELALEGERGLGRPSLEGRMLLLPVRGDSGLADRALGCVVSTGPIGRTPRRFAIARQLVTVLDGATACRPAGTASAAGVSARAGAGLAEDAAPFAPAPQAAPRRHLRLVRPDD
jgi:hypothetical protein